MTLNLILFALFGLIIGSFINVLVLRTDDLASVLTGRSECPNCKTKLVWYDLIPVLSFFILKTRCRYCNKPISWQYPVVELSTGAVFVLLYYFFGLNVATFYYAAIFSILMVAVIHDIKTEEVPEIFIWIALGLSVFGFLAGGFDVWQMLLGGLIGGGFLGAIVTVSKGKWMGSGDIKIGIIMGFLLGSGVILLGLLMAFVLGSVIGLIMMGLKRKSMQDSVPFAPFLVLAIFISLLVGNYIVGLYLGYTMF
ncbi:MAG: prepilin peptidase [Candidatus Berkelbacteria bacterium]